MITYDYESYLPIRIIKWLIYYYFCQSLKKIRNIYLCTIKESISCTIFFLWLCGWVQKQPGLFVLFCFFFLEGGGGGGGGSEKYVSRDEKSVIRRGEKSLEEFQQGSSFYIQGAVYRPTTLIKMILLKGFFNGFYRILFIVALRFSKQLFAERRMTASVCYF